MSLISPLGHQTSIKMSAERRAITLRFAACLLESSGCCTREHSSRDGQYYEDRRSFQGAQSAHSCIKHTARNAIASSLTGRRVWCAIGSICCHVGREETLLEEQLGFSPKARSNILAGSRAGFSCCLRIVLIQRNWRTHGKNCVYMLHMLLDRSCVTSSLTDCWRCWPSSSCAAAAL